VKTIRALLGGVLLVTALPAGAGEKLAMRVSPAYSYEPATLIVQLSIEPDSNNRVVRVIAESADFYRSSDIALDGDRAVRTNVISYRSLPAGDYEVRSVLFGARGQERAMVSQAVSVLNAGGR
jgi:hypothetical protein